MIIEVLMANRESAIQSQIKRLNHIKIGTGRMAKLVNDLLTLSEMSV
jgi:signal transduction histidine kinase